MDQILAAAFDVYRGNRLNFLIAKVLFRMVLGALSLYLVYRWGATVLMDSNSKREMLLGKDLNNALGDDLESLSLLIALYLGFNMLFLLINAAIYKHQLERLAGLAPLPRPKLVESPEAQGSSWLSRLYQSLLEALKPHAWYIAVLQTLFVIMMSCLSLFLVYRWCRTLQRSDKDSLEFLLGPALVSLFRKNEDWLTLFVSLNLGWSMLNVLLTAVSQKEQLEQKVLRMRRERAR